MIKETRTINSTDLRNLCINEGWYTKCNNEEYTNLFDMLRNYNNKTLGYFQFKNLTTTDLYEIAINIKNHSDTVYNICDIMFSLCQISITSFYSL